MDLYRIGMPNDQDIIVRDRFIVDELYPLCIKKLNETQYSILFEGKQLSTETTMFFQTIIGYDVTDEGFLNTHFLNVVNIQRDHERLKFYNERVKTMKGNVFNTDFDMQQDEEHKMYFKTYGIKTLRMKNSNDDRASLLDIYLTRDNFVRMYLFLSKFLNKDLSAVEVFSNKKLNNIQYMTIKHVQLNGSSENRANGLVYSSYTLGAGPTQYRMTFISPMKPNGVLVNRMLPETFQWLYMEDFVINNIIYDNHKDRIFVLYEYRSSLNNSYKATYLLSLDKEIYDHTNFVDIYKVYEKDKTPAHSLKLDD